MTQSVMTSNECERADGERVAGPESRDAELVSRIRTGEAAAWETLVRRHAGRLLSVARRFLRCDEDRADAVQETFLSAFRSIDSFAGNSSVATWLHRIVINACLMKLRRQSRARALPIDDLLPTFDEAGHHVAPIRAWTESAQAILARNEMRTQVRACIERLPDSYRTVLMLRDIEELDTDETARQLGIAPGAVKTRLHRARQALRTLLESVCFADDQ